MSSEPKWCLWKHLSYNIHWIICHFTALYFHQNFTIRPIYSHTYITVLCWCEIWSSLSSQPCNDRFMGCDFMWLGVWMSAVSIFRLEYKPLHLKFPRYTHTHTHTTVLSYFISVVSMVLLSFTGGVTGAIKPKGMRCMEHGTYWWRWEMHIKYWSVNTIVM